MKPHPIQYATLTLMVLILIMQLAVLARITLLNGRIAAVEAKQ